MHGVDYYELLGVAPTASIGEIRTAYRALAKVMHPDAGGTAGTFRLLREAYETLSDPERRAEYDREEDEDEEDAPPPIAVRRATPRIIRDDPDYVPRIPDIPLDGIPWWYQVDATVVLSSMARHEREVVFGAVTLWTVLLLALLLVSPPAPLFVGWALVLLGSGGALVAFARSHLTGPKGAFAGHRVFGDPGGGSERRAQRLTAEVLSRYLTRLPAVRIFHGLAEPGSVFADVDHAVLCGRRLVLVESKMWLPGHYDIDEDGEIWRNDHPFRGGSTQLADRLKVFTDLWPDLEIRGALLIYPTRPGDVTTDPTGADVPPMTPADFVRDVGGWLAKDPNTVDKRALAAVLDCVVT